MSSQRQDWLVESVTRLIRRGALPNVLKILDKARPIEVAAVLRSLPRPERLSTFNAFLAHDGESAAAALAELPVEVGQVLVEPLDPRQIAVLFRAMTPDDVARFLEGVPETRRDEILESMKRDEKADVVELLEFPSETAGRIMTPNVLAMNENMSVGEAIAFLQGHSEETENSFYLYVVDDRNHLVGVVSLRNLLQRFLRSPATPLKDIMLTDVISVRVDADQEEVARMVADYNLLAIPVVDAENKLAGLVTVDDVIDVIREEATEDLFALAGIDADDRALGRAPRSFQRRIPWLLVSLGTAFLAVLVVHQFKDSLQESVNIAILLPLVASLGGHAATQTMTVVVRGLSVGEVNRDTRRRALIKESLVGVFNGLSIGLMSAVAVGVYFWDVAMAVVVLLSILFIMIVAAVLGSFIPITLKRLDFDPAISSSAFVITATDVLGHAVFLTLATLALRWLAV